MDDPISSEHRALLAVQDLGVDEVRDILHLAQQFEASRPGASRTTCFSAGLLFLSPSLRTRVGFAEAAIRLGGIPIDVSELRSGPEMSTGETFADTLRTVSGMVDVVVCRVPFHLDRELVATASAAPFINAGDGKNGGHGEHPSQALIDLLAIEDHGPINELRVGICGDLRGRAPRSLVRLLNLVQPAALTLIAPPSRDDPGVPISVSLSRRTFRRAEADFSELDVLYMAGLPEGEGAHRMGVEARLAFALTKDRLRTLGADAVVLSPMPVIDEIAPEVREDPRVKVFAQSDRGVSIRMALLGRLLPDS